MALKNNRAPLLSNIKLCASFHHHMWIQTGVTVRKRLTWNLTCVTLTFCMNITFVIGNNSWKFHDDMITGTLWKRCDRQTDRRTDRLTEVFLELLGHSYKCILKRPLQNGSHSVLAAACWMMSLWQTIKRLNVCCQRSAIEPGWGDKQFWNRNVSIHSICHSYITAT